MMLLLDSRRKTRKNIPNVPKMSKKSSDEEVKKLPRKKESQTSFLRTVHLDLIYAVLINLLFITVILDLFMMKRLRHAKNM